MRLGLLALAAAEPRAAHGERRAACLAEASSKVLDLAHGRLTGNPLFETAEPLHDCKLVGEHRSNSNIAKWQAHVCTGTGACEHAYIPALIIGYPGSDPNNAADWNINRNKGCDRGWCETDAGPAPGAYAPLTVLGPAGTPRPLHVDVPGTLEFFVDDGLLGTEVFDAALRKALALHSELSLVLAGYSSGASAAAYAAMRLLETGRVPRLEPLERCAEGGLCVHLEGPYWQHSASFTHAFVNSGGYLATTTKCQQELDFPMVDTTFASEAKQNLRVAGTAWAVLNVTTLDACPERGYQLHFPATYARCHHAMALYGRNGTEVRCDYVGPSKLTPPPPARASGAGVVSQVLAWSKGMAKPGPKVGLLRRAARPRGSAP